MTRSRTSQLDVVESQMSGPLRRFFQRRVRASADVDDLLQDVFVRLARQDLTAVDNLQGYVFQIAANVLRDRARRDAVRQIVSQDDGGDWPDDKGFSPERLLLGKDMLEHLIVALTALPARTQVVFSQYHFDGVPQVQIAERLGVSLSTVEKEMARANVSLLTVLRADQ